jgi:hypothetical protein
MMDRLAYGSGLELEGFLAGFTSQKGGFGRYNRDPVESARFKAHDQDAQVTDKDG